MKKNLISTGILIFAVSLIMVFQGCNEVEDKEAM
jgi:hypothetical protein